MLQVTKDKSRSITGVERKGNALFLYSDLGTHRIIPYTDRSIRLSYTYHVDFSTCEKPGVIATPSVDWTYQEDSSRIRLITSAVTVVINRQTGSYQYFSKDGSLYLEEADTESRELDAFTTTILSKDSQNIEKINTADGEKHVVKEATLVPTGTAYHTKLRLKFSESEGLYGLGQHEEGYGSLRGKTVYCHQANRKIALPLLVSNKGYGLLIDTYSPYIFSDNELDSYIYTEADEEMDFYFIGADNMAGVIQEYRHLTGKASLLPKWAYGYLQSKERFETQEEIEAVAAEYRRRHIGIDGIILDWLSWEGDKWGQKTFDLSRFPDPTAMLNKLHDQNYHFMISIWPHFHEESEDYLECKEQGHILPASTTYDAFSKEARALYWKQASKGLFSHGVDSWWCDNCEPYTPEWNVHLRPEPGKLYAQYQEESAQRFASTMTNAYGFYHTMGIYEGQREECDKKRVTILSRSGYTGSQRHGTILWSGDICASWQTLRQQIATGLGFCASGHPYWTMDIGGFFVKNGNVWYWKGDYDNATDDLGYRELFVRWHQWGSFLPVFRGHGTDCHRELWNFGDEGTPFYDALVKANRLRYELMPYIYSVAGQTWLYDESMIRYLAFDYPEDPIACSITDQYLFGDSIMVCPVTKPMYYLAESREILPRDIRKQVYLPEGIWYDYYSNTRYKGGCYITIDAPLDRIPLFVKAGGIIPKTDFADSTQNLGSKLDIYVYTGADGHFTYYNDDGDGYNHEAGSYELYELHYCESKGRINPCSLLGREDVTIHYI